MGIIKATLSLIVAVAVTYVLTSVMGTQFVLAEIQSFGLNISISDRIAATLHDIAGLVPVLLILVSATFLIAFIIASIGARLFGSHHKGWYLAAGFTSLPVTMVLIKTAMGITPFAAAGSAFGLFLIALCGLAGGWVFVLLLRHRGA